MRVAEVVDRNGVGNELERVVITVARERIQV